LTNQLHAGQNSPFGRAKVLDDTVADAYPKPQMWPIAGAFQPRGQKALETGLPVGVGMHGCLAKELRSDDQSPSAADREFAACTRAKEQLIAVGTTRQNQAFGGPKLHTELTRIRKAPDIASGEQSEHPTIPAVRYVIGTSAGWDEELRSCAQAERTPRLSQKAHVEADGGIGKRIRVRGDIYRRTIPLVPVTSRGTGKLR